MDASNLKRETRVDTFRGSGPGGPARPAVIFFWTFDDFFESSMMNVAEFLHTDPGTVSRQALEELVGLLARQAAREDCRVDGAGDGKSTPYAAEVNWR